MTITISTEHRDARLIGTRDFLDAGTGNAKIQIYDNSGARPGNGLATTCVLLTEIELDKPCGTVSGGLLTLTSSDTPLVQATGDALWARVVTANNTHAFDCDVSDPSGTGEIQLPNVTLYAGGTTVLVSGTLG